MEERRRLIDLCLAAGNKRKSCQTGFIHYCHEGSEETNHDTIPLYENLCFALGLFRSKSSEDIAEAKTLLEKLLAFSVAGNFPIYLHDYPLCKDPYHFMHLYPALYFIKRDFSSILGESLLKKLEEQLKQMALLAQQLDSEGKLPAVLKLKMQDRFDILGYTPKTSKEWADLLIGLSMQQKENIDVISHAASYWHPQLLQSLSKKKEMQDKYEPSATLFDLVMGSLFGAYSKRALQEQPLHLQASLIFPPPHVPEQQILLPYNLQLAQESEAFYLSWGGKECLHTLVAPYKRCSVEASNQEKEVTLYFTLSETLPEEGEQSVEIAFFTNLHDQKSLTINALKASTFQLEDVVCIATGEQKITLHFSLVEGEGIFFGHLARANRPSQIGCKGIHTHEAYDWRIALRTIKRSPTCTIKATLTLAMV